MSKVICFDFDDVLTSKSTLSRLTKLFGNKFQEVKFETEMLEDNRNPKKFFKDVKGVVKFAKGIPYKYVEHVATLIKLNKNAKKVLVELKKRGYKIAIVSINDRGLIKKFLERNRIDIYIDRIYASRIGVKGGLITGEIYGDVIKTEKVGIVRKIEKAYNLKRHDIVYIGDGMTDLPIMKKIGRAILFCPNPIANAEVLADKNLMKMKKEGRLMLIEKNDLLEIIKFIE